MPITRSALRKVRVDRRRAAVNDRTRTSYKEAIKAVREKPSTKLLSAAFSALDRAAKKHVIHRNKAARLKHRLAGLL